MMNGKRLPYIPFVLIGRNGEAIDPQKPVLLDLVDVNMSHYRGTADYDTRCTSRRCPRRLLPGMELQAGQSLKIGSSEAWVFSRPRRELSTWSSPARAWTASRSAWSARRA